MSVLRAAWGPLFERRHQGLSRMMGFSVLLHVFLFLFMVVNQVFFASQPRSFQGFQVTLIIPESRVSSLGESGTASKKISRSKVKSLPSTSKSKRAKTLASLKKPTSAKTIKLPSVTRAPRTSVKAMPKEEDDPERLQEWWKKQKKMLAVPESKSITKPKKGSVKKTRTAKIDIQKHSLVSSPLPGKATEPQQAVQNPQSKDSLEQSPSKVDSGEEKAPLSGSSDSEGSTHSMKASVSPGIKGVGVLSGGTSFFFPNYLQKVDQKIRWQWAPPPVASSGDKLVIRFVVKKDGSIDKSSVSIEESSGNHFFDQSAMRAVYAAHPLPPLPKAYGGGMLTVYMNFVVTEEM